MKKAWITVKLLVLSHDYHGDDQDMVTHQLLPDWILIVGVTTHLPICGHVGAIIILRGHWGPHFAERHRSSV